MRGKRVHSGWRQKVPLVLVADPDDELRERTCSYLRYAGFMVQPARTGEQALEHVSRQVPSVALVDLGSSVVEGLELVRRLKADHRMSSVTIIAVSAEASGHEAAAHEAGCDALLPKACPPQRLVSTVMRALGAARRNASEG